jgi:putative tributyrin esterase
MTNSGDLGTIELSDPQFERDHLRMLTFKSDAMKCRVDVTLFVPDAVRHLSDVPLVILLHGVYGSHWAWFLKGGAHETAAALIETNRVRPLVLASPSDGYFGDGSAYIDHSGRKFEQWISTELPLLLRNVLPCLGEKTPIFLAGLSMGGYGALRIGAKHPTLFTGLSAHSAITELAQMQSFVHDFSPFQAVDVHDADLLGWCRVHKNSLPPLRFDCGRLDPLLECNRQLHRQLQELSIQHQYDEFHGGHTWPYWTEHLQDTLLFFEEVLHATAE